MTQVATQTEQPSPGSADQQSLEDRIADKLYGSEEPEQVEETQADSAATEESAQPETPEVPLEEVEFDGVKLGQYPKETAEKVKSALMAQKDYTVKTQEIAEQRRMVEMRAQQLQHENQFQQSISSELQALHELEAQIAQYGKVNWASLNAEDMMRARFALDNLKEQKAGVEKQIQGKRGEFDQKINSVKAEARTRSEALLKKAIPNWGPDVQKELTDYGMREGFSDIELASIVDHRNVISLWKASQWDKLQSQKGTVLKEAAKAPPVIKPGASTQQTAKATAEAKYRSDLRNAKTPAERSRIIQDKFAKKLGL